MAERSTASARVAADAVLLAALVLATLVAGCPHFQPEVALQPTPYARASSFALGEGVTYRPDLDDHRLAIDPSVFDPRELDATPRLVTQCMTNGAVSDRGAHTILPPGVAHADAFTLSLVLTLAVPGFTRGAQDSASATAPGATASASAVRPSEGASATAAAILEIRATDGTLIDRVRIFAQRFPRIGEPLDARAGALCRILLEETQHYLDWRIDGRG